MRKSECGATFFFDPMSSHSASHPGSGLAGGRHPLVKLFDERALGAGMFVTAVVREGGRLAWERTEIYRERA